MTKNAEGVLLKKSKLTTNGKPNLPAPSKLVEGELAINYAEGVETISTKNESGTVVTFSSDDYYTTKKLGEYFTGENSAKTVTEVMIQKERVTAEALIDLDNRKLEYDELPDELWFKGNGTNAVKLDENSTANGNYSVAEGYETNANGGYSHAEGFQSSATGVYCHAEGNKTVASGEYSHAEGGLTTANTYYAHAEGGQTKASGQYSHAEGQGSTASGNYGAHAEGYQAAAKGQSSHAEGNSTTASGQSSHAEGGNTIASGYYSHAEGNVTTASGQSAHAEGQGSSALTYGAHSEGAYSVASGESAHAEGNRTKAISTYSHAEGASTISSGGTSHAEGDNSIAGGAASHAEGYHTQANGSYTHAEGSTTSATSDASHAEGNRTLASGNYSHAEGDSTIASGQSSHSEGASTSAMSYYSHAEGNRTLASGNHSHAEGDYTSATTTAAHAEGYFTKASGDYGAHSEGNQTVASGNYSHAEGSGTTASNIAAHAEGKDTTAGGQSSHAEGITTYASMDGGHAEGYSTQAISSYSHAEGSGTTASNIAAHAEGESTTAKGQSSHAEGQSTSATSTASHAEGKGTTASGSNSHAEGDSTIASGQTSHAEGYNTKAYGQHSHAEGNITVASGVDSHAEGFMTTANTLYAHSEGVCTLASGLASHTEGVNTNAKNQSEHASGQYNISSSASTEFGNSGNTLFSVGNGTANNARHNAFEIRQNGDIYIVNKAGNDVKLQDEIDSINTSITSHTNNSTIHVTSSDKTAWNNKIGYAEYDSTDKKIYFYKNDTDTATSLCYVDATDFIKDGMVDNVEVKNVPSSGTCLVITFNTDSGKEAINIPISDIFDASNYYTKSETSGKTELSTEFALYVKSEDVDQVIDETTSASTNPVSTSAVYDVITDNELVWANAFVTLSGAVSSHTENTNIHVTSTDKNNLATLADNIEVITSITPTNISNWNNAATNSHSHSNKSALDSITGNVGTMAYEATSSYSSATQVNTALGNKAAQSDLNTLSGTVTGHTADTNIHLTSTQKENIDSLETNIDAISGITSTDITNWDNAATDSHTHSNKTYLDSITGNVGTMAYEATTSYSSATDVNTALGNKLGTSEFNTYSGAVDTAIGSKASQSDLNALSGAVTSHTADNSIHLSSTQKENLDSLATNIAAISGITSTKVGNWDTAATNTHSHSNTAALNSITGSVGTMAYEDTTSYSSATQVNTALGGKSDTGHTHDDRYYTESELTGSSTTVVVAKAASATTAATAAVANSVALSNVSGADDIKAIEALTGTSGLLKKTAANTWALDTTSYSSATDVNTALSGKSDTGHTHDASGVTAMTGYQIASSSASVLTTDSLLQTIGKLEKRILILEAALGGMTLVKLTSQQYADLTDKDPNTMYIIND